MSTAAENILGNAIEIVSEPLRTLTHEALPHTTDQAAPRSLTGTLTVMEAIGRDCLKELAIVQKYLPSAATISNAIFSAEVAGIREAISVVTLIENAVAAVEAKWTAAGAATKTGSQKLADVLALIEAAVVDLLARLGINADNSFIVKLINIIVSILNLRTTSSS